MRRVSPRLRHDLDTLGWHVVAVLAGFLGFMAARHRGWLDDSRGAEVVLVCGVALAVGIVAESRSRSRPERAQESSD